MMILLFWLVGLFVIVLQTAILPCILPALWIPDLLFIFVAFCAYRFSWVGGVFLVFTVAWMQDVVSAVELGFYPLECIAIFACFKLLTHNTPVKTVVYQLPLVGGGYIVWQLFTYAIYTLFHVSHPLYFSSPELVFETGLVVVSTFPCFLLFTRMTEWIDTKKLWMKPPRRRPKKRNE